jgi:hypothetical protein
MPGRAIVPLPSTLRALRTARPSALRREAAALATTTARPPVANSGLAATARSMRAAVPASPKRLAMPARTSTAGVVHGELGDPALGHLALDPWQRRPNQLAMNRAVHSRSVRLLAFRSLGERLARELAGVGFSRLNRRSGDNWRGCRRHDHAGWRQRRRPCGGFLLSRWRHLRRAIVVFGVARRASHLANIVIHHRHDRVITDAPFARTVVIH